MSDRIEEMVIDLRVDNARMEEKILNLEGYVLKDLKDSLDGNSKKMEARFKWMVGIFIVFVSISIGLPLSLCGGG